MFKPTQVAFTLLLSLLGLLFSCAAQAQIPVTDAANLTQQFQQVKSWAQQLKAMADQAKQAKQQYESLTGNRGMGNVLNDPSLQQYFKGDETPNAQAFRQTYGNASYCDTAGYQTNEQRQLCRDQATRMGNMNQPYKDYEQLNRALNVANKKPEQIQGLIQQINETDDPKAIAELQARIAGEQANMQNEYVKMQITLQQMQIQNQAIKDQQSRAASERTKAEFENARRARQRFE